MMDNKLAAKFVLFLEELKVFDKSVYIALPDWLKIKIKERSKPFNLLSEIVDDLMDFLVYLTSFNNEVFIENFEKVDISFFIDFLKYFEKYSILPSTHDGNPIENTLWKLEMFSHTFRMYPQDYIEFGIPPSFDYLFFYEEANKNKDNFMFVKLLDFYTAFGKNYIDNNKKKEKERYINYDIAIGEFDLQVDAYIEHLNKGNSK